MRIISWNVNGLRANLNRGSLDWLMEQKADVLCLQEIKTRPDQLGPEMLAKLNGYSCSWNPAEKPGYSGVATLSKASPEMIVPGMGAPEYDREGRLLVSRQAGFTLVNGYFPNGQRDQGRLDYKLGFYRQLLETCDRWHSAGEQIVICGDLNTAHQEIDLRNARQNTGNSGFLPEERAWIDLYLEHGFVDVFRTLYPDKVQYTWWTYIGNARARNTGWRLDYFLVSRSMMGRIRDSVIHDDVPGSDHCPVSLYLD